MAKRETVVSNTKCAYEEKLNDLFDNYARILFCTMENVRSQQIHNIRQGLRGRGVLLIGKKTHQRKIVSNRAGKKEASDMDKMFASSAERHSLLRGSLAMLFTNCEVSEISQLLDSHRVQAPARVGAIAPCDVTIPAGNTGIEPGETSFFQALNIETKISKGAIEIISSKKVVSEGCKVDNSTAVLLSKLKIYPFFYAMHVQAAWDRGVVFSKDDLDIVDDTVEETMKKGITMMTALSVGAGIPTAASIPFLLADAFKNMLAVSIGSSYTFSEYGAEKTRADVLEGKLVAASTTAAVAPVSTTENVNAPEGPAAEGDDEEDDDFGLGILA